MNFGCGVILLLLSASWICILKAAPTTDGVETQTIKQLSSESMDPNFDKTDAMEATTYEPEKEESAVPIAIPVALKPSKPSNCHHAHRVSMVKPPKHNSPTASSSLSQLWSYVPALPQQSAFGLSSISSLQSPYMPPTFYPIPIYLPYFIPVPQPEAFPSNAKSNSPKRKMGTKNSNNEPIKMSSSENLFQLSQERHGGWQQKWNKPSLNDTDEQPVRQNIFKEWKGNWQNRTHFKDKFTKLSNTTTEVPTNLTIESTTAETNDIPKKHFFDEWKQKFNNRTDKFNENSTETNSNQKHKIIDAWKDKWFGHPNRTDTNPTPSVRLAAETANNLENVPNDTITVEAV